MKTILLLFVLLSFITLKAQSIISIGTDANIDISMGADICSDSLSGSISGEGSFCGNPTDVEIGQSDVIPTEFVLEQNFPNPFNPSTKISWQSPLSGYQTLKVYDVLGKEVATLVDENKSAGSYEVEFDASNLSSGLYLCKLQAGDFVSTKKMILIK